MCNGQTSEVSRREIAKSKMPPNGSSSVARPFVVVVFGPIGVGKTRLIDRLALMNPDWIVGHEPTGNPTSQMLLEDVYKGAPHGPAVLQTYLAHERSIQHTNLTIRTKHSPRPVIVLDGHLFTDSNVYVKFGHELTGRMTRAEITAYTTLVTTILQEPTQLWPDYVICLHARTDVCRARCRRRGRPMEKTLDIDFFFTHCAAVTSTLVKLEEIVPCTKVDTTLLSSRVVADRVNALIQDRYNKHEWDV